MVHCLVIEDSESMRRIMGRILTELGYRVSQAPGPASAIDAYRVERPDVVFLDWDLPDLGALDFLRAAGRPGEDGPVMILSATVNNPQELDLAKAAGVQHHILKPFDFPTIRMVMKKAGFDYVRNDYRHAALA